MKACHTNCRFRYSNDTSRLTWLVGGVRRSRRRRSSKVRYLPLTRKTRKEVKAAMEWIVAAVLVARESN